MNLTLYDKVRCVPDNAKRAIEAGRLKGKTDINPMWRIKVLTEQFGPCGVGWVAEITRQWLEAGANGEIAAFVEIKLFVKLDGEWSKGIPGLGGSMFVAKEKNGLYTSDEAYKMAYTDALSVACKALGIGADVYWDKDKTKYAQEQPPQSSAETVICPACGKPVKALKMNDGTIMTAQQIVSKYGMCVSCLKAASGR